MQADVKQAGPPKAALIGTGVLIGLTLILVMIGRGQSVDLSTLAAERPVSSLDFRAEDQVDGSIAIRNAADGHVVEMIQPQRDGFIRGTLRGLARTRQASGLGAEQPFTLMRYDDGRLALNDAATGRYVTLDAFGHTNALAFARLLPADNRTQ